TITASSLRSVLSSTTTPASGTVTLTVFGPQSTAPTSCTTGGTTVGTATVTAPGTYNPSAAYTPEQIGTYWWYASYAGGANNNAAASTSGTGMASTTVAKASPSTTLGVPANDVANTPIAGSSITATLASSTTPASGTITFYVV